MKKQHWFKKEKLRSWNSYCYHYHTKNGGHKEVLYLDGKYERTEYFNRSGNPIKSTDPVINNSIHNRGRR